MDLNVRKNCRDVGGGCSESAVRTRCGRCRTRAGAPGGTAARGVHARLLASPPHSASDARRAAPLARGALERRSASASARGEHAVHSCFCLNRPVRTSHQTLCELRCHIWVRGQSMERRAGGRVQLAVRGLCTPAREVPAAGRALAAAAAGEPVRRWAHSPRPRVAARQRKARTGHLTYIRYPARNGDCVGGMTWHRAGPIPPGMHSAVADLAEIWARYGRCRR